MKQTCNAAKEHRKRVNRAPTHHKPPAQLTLPGQGLAVPSGGDLLKCQSIVGKTLCLRPSESRCRIRRTSKKVNLLVCALAHTDRTHKIACGVAAVEDTPCMAAWGGQCMLRLQLLPTQELSKFSRKLS